MTHHVPSIKTCPVCGLRFEARHCDKIYCSPKCRDKAVYMRKTAGTVRKCVICGAQVGNRFRYCSDECRKKAGRYPRSCKSITKPQQKHVPSYAEIRAANLARPIANGWRGQMVAGGGAKVVA